MKQLSNWPTFPQLYADGELIGGADIVKALKDSGDLATQLKLSSSPQPEPEPTSRLRALVGRSRVMGFIKGTPESPKCGFSAKFVRLLKV